MLANKLNKKWNVQELNLEDVWALKLELLFCTILGA
jgi:hypothetical protein